MEQEPGQIRLSARGEARQWRDGAGDKRFVCQGESASGNIPGRGDNQLISLHNHLFWFFLDGSDRDAGLASPCSEAHGLAMVPRDVGIQVPPVSERWSLRWQHARAGDVGMEECRDGGIWG